MKTTKESKSQRRIYPEDLKQEAVQMVLDGHSASSGAENLGLSHTSLLCRLPRRMPGGGRGCGRSGGNTNAATGLGGLPPNWLPGGGGGPGRVARFLKELGLVAIPPIVSPAHATAPSSTGLQPDPVGGSPTAPR
jgi:hypothetical protein